MNIIKKKLKSEHGVSVLFGLLAFMVAAMVSITIVSASVSTTLRVHDDIEENQARLTLLSAAKLVQHEVEQSRILYISVDEMVSKTTVYSDGSIDIADPEYAASEPQLEAEGPLGDEILQAVCQLEDNNFAESVNSSVMTVELEDKELDKVDVSFVMKASADLRYELYFTLQLEQSPSYRLYMKIILENPPATGEKIQEGAGGADVVSNQSALRASLREENGFPMNEPDKTTSVSSGDETVTTTYSLDIQEGNSGIKEYVWSANNAEISEVEKVE